MILVNVFNFEYLCQLSTKYKNQELFWNLLVMRILKLPLLYEFEKELTEIFKVKDKAQNPKSYSYFFLWLYNHNHIYGIWYGICFDNLNILIFFNWLGVLV